MKTKQQKIQTLQSRIKTSWFEGIFVGVLLFIYNYFIQIIFIEEQAFDWISALYSFAVAMVGGLLLGAFIKWFCTRRLNKLLQEP